jgi:predicted transcriptional regulator
LMYRAKVKDYMEKGPATVGLDATLDEVIGKMVERRKAGVIVLSGLDIVGLVNFDEVLHILVQGKDPHSVQVSELLEACSLVGENPCLQISEESTVIDALRVMNIGQTERLLVVDGNGKLSGSISFLDAIKAYKE